MLTAPCTSAAISCSPACVRLFAPLRLLDALLWATLQGNFAEFLENADSVVNGVSAEGGESFVNMFALPELKVCERACALFFSLLVNF